MIKTTYFTMILETPTYVILSYSSLYTLIPTFSYTTLQPVVDKVTLFWVLCNTWQSLRPSPTLTLFFSHSKTAPSRPGSPHYRGFTITLRHTTSGKTPLDE